MIAMIRTLPRCVIAIALLSTLAVAGCGRPEVARGINDPYEAQNRQVHEFNRNVDKVLLRPASQGYGTIIPDPIKQGVSNVAGNLSMPSYILNDVLQARFDDAAHNFTRLLINSTFGLAGVLDPATAWGLAERGSDFGETLNVWGFAEGHYIEVPFLGPSTKRDAVGVVVNFVIDPLGYMLPKPERYIAPATAAASTIGDRYRFGDTIDSILYDSTDSYAQARLFYLESRRFQLGGTQDESLDDYDDYDAFYE